MAYDISESLENHHSDWSTREGVSGNQLGYHVQTDLLVCDRLDHPCGHNIECGD
jgi:hypothetical protein